MRILIVVILSVLYLGASTGVTLNMHYCMGELAETTFANHSTDNTICAKCGMENEEGKDNGCCKDEKKLVKAQEQNSVSKTLIFTEFSVVSDLPKYHFIDSLTNLYAERYFNNHLPNGPPLVETSSYPIYIQVRHILI